MKDLLAHLVIIKNLLWSWDFVMEPLANFWNGQQPFPVVMGVIILPINYEVDEIIVWYVEGIRTGGIIEVNIDGHHI